MSIGVIPVIPAITFLPSSDPNIEIGIDVSNTLTDVLVDFFLSNGSFPPCPFSRRFDFVHIIESKCHGTQNNI